MSEFASVAARICAGDFTHEAMVEVVRDLIPSAVHGRDFLVGQHIGDDGEKDGDPFLLQWKLPDDQPDPAALKEMFEADREKYVGRLVRRLRDGLLEWSDGKADVPSDAPPSVQERAARWKSYRNALRNIPEQAGFPLNVEWPSVPDA